MKYNLKNISLMLALMVIIISINSFNAAAISAEDKNQVSSQLDSLVKSINSGEINNILNLISPNARVDLANEIETQLRGKKINYEMEILSFEEIENNKIKVKCRFAASGIGWSISGLSNFFVFEKVDTKWLIIDTDFHQKLSSEYVFEIIGKIFTIIGIIFLLILIIGIVAYNQVRKKHKSVSSELDISDPVKTPKLDYQGVGIRFAAALIDLIIAFFIPFLFIFILVLPSLENIEVFFLAILIVVFFPFAYDIILEGTKGATIGKMVCGIRVVHEDGTPCDMPSAIVRNLLRLIDGSIGYFIWTSDKKQRLGDKVAKTVVVKIKTE
jgi:uncharacterized RDD family membrane protein YckC